MAVLEIKDARKAFGATRALDGLSLSLGEGELLGLLGPNGAGKTTLIRAIAGRVRLDGGTVSLYGRTLEPEKPRHDLGVVPQENALYPLLTARENLETFGRLNGIEGKHLNERIAWALEWTGLGDRAKEPIRNFSGGMKRRLNLACGVLHKPRVVLLDEPTVGVDPQSRERLYDMLATLRAEGAALLLTTHQLEEAEKRCDRVTIVDHGKVIASGTLSDVVASAVGTARRVTLTVDRVLADGLQGATATSDGRTWMAPIADLDRELPDLLARVRAAGAHLDDMRVERLGLHDVFLELTGKELRE